METDQTFSESPVAKAIQSLKRINPKWELTSVFPSLRRNGVAVSIFFKLIAVRFWSGRKSMFRGILSG